MDDNPDLPPRLDIPPPLVPPAAGETEAEREAYFEKHTLPGLHEFAQTLDRIAVMPAPARSVAARQVYEAVFADPRMWADFPPALGALFNEMRDKLRELL